METRLDRTSGNASARILIVEDDADLRHLYSTHLTLAGYTVEAVDTGFAALIRVEQRAPDLLILDLGLPLVSGECVANELAASAHTRDIPVVIVTGQLTAQIPASAACALWKPVMLPNLVTTVRRCLEESALGVARRHHARAP